jgi:hypothetical protein
MIVCRANVVLRLQRGDLTGSRAAAAEGAHLEALTVAADRSDNVEFVERDEDHTQPNLAAFGQMWSAMHALAEGRIDDAEAANAALANVAREPNFINSWGAQFFRIRRQQGRVAELVPLLRQMVNQTPGLVALRSGLALALTDTDDLLGGRLLFEPLIANDLASVPRDTTWSAALADLTEVAAALGDQDAAAVLHHHLDAFAGQVLVIAWGVTCLGAADSYLGLLDTVLGHHAEAQERFARALALEATAAPALVPRTERWRGN